MPVLARFTAQRNGSNDVFDAQFTSTLGNSLAATEAPDTVSSAGSVAWNAALATVEAQDVASFLSLASVQGTLSVSEDPDGADIFGGSDLLDAVGTVVWRATLAATDDRDVAAFFASNLVTGALGATEAADIFAATGTGSVYGALAATENTQDTAAMTGTGGVVGALAVTEDTVDTAAMAGLGSAYGTLAVTEVEDTAVFRAAGISSGTLDATDSPDTAAATATVLHTAVLAATEAADGVVITGVVGRGFMLATEASDVFAIAALRGDVGVLNANEAPSSSDVAQIIGFLPTTGTFGTADLPDVFTGAGSLTPLSTPEPSPGQRRGRLLKAVKDGQAKLKASEPSHYAPVRIVATATDTTIVAPEYEVRIDGLARVKPTATATRSSLARVRPLSVVNPTDEEILRLVMKMTQKGTRQAVR